MHSEDIFAHWISADGTEGRQGDPAARFPYWSLTKTVLAVCAVRLAARGALELDKVQEPAPYTLRQLLAHRAGLPDYTHLEAYHQAVAAGLPAWTLEAMLARAMPDDKVLSPGAKWSYSNIGYMFVARCVAAAARVPLREAIDTLVCQPLGLQSVVLAEGPADFQSVHWEAAKRYDPRWVYHGCLVGTPADAARLLHGVYCGGLIDAETLAEMSEPFDLGGALPGRPWSRCGYGIGLMAGRVEGAGRGIGHSGAGPFCVNAAYRFPDLARPITVATFTGGTDEGVAENAAVSIAMRAQ